MAKGYWVVNLSVTDPALMAEYTAFIEPFLTANHGRFVIRGGEMEVTEGAVHRRVVVVEFPSYDHARRVYHSEEYQKGSSPRWRSSTANFAIVEGLPL